jgi:hypothetical protein
MEYRLLGVLFIAVLVSGCTSSTAPEGETGRFALYVSDQPADISSFKYLNVTFDRARIFSENFSEGDESNETGFRSFEMNSTVDLTRVVGDDAEKVLEEDLEPGTYRKVELHTADILGVVENETVDVKVPSRKLMIQDDFEISVDRTTEFVFDIQVVEKGENGYNLMPVISESGVAGKDVEISR